MKSDSVLLSVRGLTKRFGGLTAVDDVFFDVKSGEIVGVIGPNGAGKSTLFNLVTGLMSPTAGEVAFRGEDMGRVPANRRSAIGMTRTFQIVRVFGELSVLENVMIGGHSKIGIGFFESFAQIPRVFAQNRKFRTLAMDWLDRLGLADFAYEQAGHLSHGQQRLLEIARAMVGGSDLLLLDEPAAGLNGKETADLFAILRTINEAGTAILIVEHDIKFVMSLCNKIVVLDHGIRIAEGTPEQVRRNSAVIEAYLGKWTADAAH